MTHPTFTRAEAAGWIRAAGRALGKDSVGVMWAHAVETEGAQWVFDCVRTRPRRPEWMTVRGQLLRIFVRRLCRHIRD